MYLDRLKSVDAKRASRLTGIARGTIYKAMDLYRDSNGRLGLAYFVETKRRKIRLCAIDDWISKMEREAIYG